MNRRNCVIISSESDYHACAIRFAVRAAGGICDILNTTKLIHRSTPGASISLIGGKLDLGGLNFDQGPKSIWARRMFRSKEMNDISPKYIDYIRNESIEFERNIFKNFEVGDNYHWINKISNIYAAEVKSYQLSMASRSGLLVPDTLITANPDLIRRFCEKYNSIVIKPFNPHTWQDDSLKKRWTTFANVLSSSDIEVLNDAELAAAPCIFQEYIPTISDVRVGVIGNEMFALEMRHAVDGRIDFRTMGDEELIYSKCLIPENVVYCLKKLMVALDINVASADFILGKDGQWHFIELNPSGAFLFLEDRCSDIRILSAAASLMCYGTVKKDHEHEFPCLESFVKSEDHKLWTIAIEEHRLTNNSHLTRLY